MHTHSGTPHRVARSAFARVATAPTPFDHTLPLPALSAAKAAEVLARLEAPPPEPVAPRARALPFVGPRRRAAHRATIPGVGIKGMDVPPPRDQIPTSRERRHAFDRHSGASAATAGLEPLAPVLDLEAHDEASPPDESEPIASVLSIEPREPLPRAANPRRTSTHFALVAIALAVALGALGLVAWRAEGAARARAAAPTDIEASDPAAMTPTQP